MHAQETRPATIRWGVLLLALSLTVVGCSDQTIDKAAQETKEIVDATARASKRASEASERIARDAKQGTDELIERVRTPSDSTVEKSMPRD